MKRTPGTLLRFLLLAIWTVAGSTAQRGATNASQRARAYNRERNRLTLIGLAFDAALGSWLALGGVAGPLRDRAGQVSPSRYATRSLMTMALGLIQGLAGLPLAYYRGFVLEHKYDLSAQTRRAWAWDQAKAVAIGVPFALLISNAVYAIIERWPRRWWLIMTALTLPLTVLLSQLAPVLILPIFNRYEPLRDQVLAARLKRLAARSGIRVAEVLQMDMSRQTRKANAFFTGIGSTRRIVLADTLLDRFTPEEIEVVVAHEIAHQAHRDIWRLIAMGTVATAGSSWLVDRLARALLRRAPHRVGADRLEDVATLPLMTWLLSLVGLALAPLQNAYSRRRERAADQFALELSDDPAAFLSAMRRLAESNLADPAPSRLVKYALYSHPPIAERLEHGERYARERSR